MYQGPIRTYVHTCVPFAGSCSSTATLTTLSRGTQDRGGLGGASDIGLGSGEGQGDTSFDRMVILVLEK